MHVHYGCSKSLFYLNIILSFFVIFRLRNKTKSELWIWLGVVVAKLRKVTVFQLKVTILVKNLRIHA